MNLFENIPPPGKKRAAVIIGRFNPPTKGHYELINEVKKFIKSNPNLRLEAMPVVVVIGNDKKRKDAEDLIKNPLTVHDRVVFMQSSGHANGVKFITASNAFEALGKCRSEGLEPIAIAAGTDRIDDYIRILDQYFKDENDKPIKHEKIHLARDEGAIETKKAVKADNIDDQLAAIKGGEEVTTDIVSGSLARRAAELGYFDEFSKIVGLEHNRKLATLLYNKVKKVLELANQQKEQTSKKNDLKESFNKLSGEIEQIFHSVYDNVKRESGDVFAVRYEDTDDKHPYETALQIRPDKIVVTSDVGAADENFIRSLHTKNLIPKHKNSRYARLEKLISRLAELESVQVVKIVKVDDGYEKPFTGNLKVKDEHFTTIYIYYEDKR